MGVRRTGREHRLSHLLPTNTDAADGGQHVRPERRSRVARMCTPCLSCGCRRCSLVAIASLSQRRTRHGQGSATSAVKGVLDLICTVVSRLRHKFDAYCCRDCPYWCVRVVRWWEWVHSLWRLNQCKQFVSLLAWFCPNIIQGSAGFEPDWRILTHLRPPQPKDLLPPRPRSTPLHFRSQSLASFSVPLGLCPHFPSTGQ